MIQQSTIRFLDAVAHAFIRRKTFQTEGTLRDVFWLDLCNALSLASAQHVSNDVLANGWIRAPAFCYLFYAGGRGGVGWSMLTSCSCYVDAT